MTETYSTRQVCEATGVLRYQLDQWVSNGYIKPSNDPEKGRGRAYDFREALKIALIDEIVTLGLSAKDAARYVWNLHAFKKDRAILVIFRPAVHLIQATERGAPPAPPGPKVYSPMMPLVSDIMTTAAFTKLMQDPDTRGVIAIPIDVAEQRLKDALARVGAD